MLDRLDDTIVAISSPVGTSLRGVIRLSGPRALSLAAAVFENNERETLSETGGHRRLFGHVRIDAAARVPAEAYVFRAPASYTRQDVLELHTVGSPPVLAMVLDLLTAQGARAAEPGEFTARAYFAGAMDLTRVEGVAAMIHARNDSQLRASQALLHGKLSQQTTAFRDRLADLLALIEAEIDFAEEPIDFISLAQLAQTVDEITDALGRLYEHAPAVERLDVLPEVLLVGRPNTGKSTLFNRLTGMDRAIQSATAGTTRDVISAPLTVPGGEVLLLDSAGLFEAREQSEPSSAAGLVELAERATRRSLVSADVIVLLVDVNAPFEAAGSLLADEWAGRPLLIAAHKIDMLTPQERASWMAQAGGSPDLIAVSSRTGEGIDKLRIELGRRLFSGLESTGTQRLALSNRQRDALRSAHDALQRARRLCDASSTLCDHTELLALEVREAMNALSLLVGEVATEELLDRIFSRFCIGK